MEEVIYIFFLQDLAILTRWFWVFFVVLGFFRGKSLKCLLQVFGYRIFIHVTYVISKKKRVWEMQAFP